LKLKSFSLIIVFITLMCCFIFSQEVVSSSIYIVDFFYDYMFPSLLPLLVAIFILIDTGILYYLAYILQYITIPLFRLNGYGALVILISILTGFPFSTILMCKFYKENKLSKKEAYSLLLSFTIPSFSFIFATLKGYIETTSFYKLILCLYLTSFIILFIISNITLDKKEYTSFSIIKKEVEFSMKNFSFPTSLKENILSITDSLAIVLGTMVYFNIISIFINNIFPINNTIEGMIEFSFPAVVAAKANNILSLLIILSFSSLSCIFQCSTVLDEYKFKTYPLVISKSFSLILSLILFYIF